MHRASFRTAHGSRWYHVIETIFRERIPWETACEAWHQSIIHAPGTDHRIGFTIQKLDRVMEGELDEILDALIHYDQEMKMAGENH